MYHGRILLPHNYPMKPPNIVFLTPNGRFEVGMKICLTVSAHHPETWQPSWSIRTVLTAITGFMPTPGGGAIGSIDYSPEVRHSMALESVNWRCDVCGLTNKEQLPEEDETLSVSSSDLSTSVGAVMEEQSKFPIGDIRIEKIERLDASPKQPEGLRHRKPAGNDNNNNNAQEAPAAAPPAAAVAPAPVRVVPAESPQNGMLDVLIAAVFFAILWLVISKWL